MVSALQKYKDSIAVPRSEMTDQPGNHVKSVTRALDIVEALKDLNGGGVSEVADRVEIPPSTVHNYLATLQAREYVVTKGSEYHLADRFIHIGDFAKNRHDLVNVGEWEIEPLVEETDETVNLVVEEYGMGIYVHSRTGAGGLRNFAHIREREYLHSTSAGKALLANLPEERVEAILANRGLPRQTSSTITDRSELLAQLSTIRERGYSLNDEENTPGVRAVGAPIEMETGDFAAVSVAGPINRFTDEMFYDELPDMVRRTAKSIEVDLVA